MKTKASAQLISLAIMMFVICGCSRWIQEHTPGHGPIPKERYPYDTQFEDEPPHVISGTNHQSLIQQRSMAVQLQSATKHAPDTNTLCVFKWIDPDPGVIVGYNLYRGTRDGFCTNLWASYGAITQAVVQVPMGTNYFTLRSLTWQGYESTNSNQIHAPAWLYMTVVGSNLMCTLSLLNPFHETNSPWSAVNPASNQFFKSRSGLTTMIVEKK